MKWADKSESYKMQRGSSVNFQPVKSAAHSVSHADRSVPPSYLLPQDRSLGTIVVLDDHGAVAKMLDAKMALASRQAKRQGDYAPIWEGVINLRRPNPGEDSTGYKKECGLVVEDWIEKYETMTGHKVLRADVHLDEGHILDGETLLNSHSHVVCDRTNEAGRVLKTDPKKMREIQSMTSEVTTLERGVSAKISGKKHITSHQYKYLAERGKLENQALKDKLKESQNDNVMLVDTLQHVTKKADSKINELEEKYKADRARMKQENADALAAGLANMYSQKDYQALKKAHEAALAELLQAKVVIAKMGSEMQEIKSELDVVKAKFAVMADAYQAEKAKGIPPHLIVPTANEPVDQNEVQRRINLLPTLLKKAGTELVFGEIARMAVSAKDGDPWAVDWLQVENLTIHKATANNQGPETIASAIGKVSPGATLKSRCEAILGACWAVYQQFTGQKPEPQATRPRGPR